MKKGWVWLIAASLVLYVVKSPSEAGNTAENLLSGIGAAIGKLAIFVSELIS